MALLGVSSGIKLKVGDDFLDATPSVAEFMDFQADLNTLGSVKNSALQEEIPDNMQVTYPDAIKYLSQGAHQK